MSTSITTRRLLLHDWPDRLGDGHHDANRNVVVLRSGIDPQHHGLSVSSTQISTTILFSIGDLSRVRDSGWQVGSDLQWTIDRDCPNGTWRAYYCG